VFVAPHGDDAASGTALSHPVATLERARDIARRLNAHTVSVSEGVYQLERTLELGPADGGVTWAGLGSVSMSGGVRVDGWEPVPSPAHAAVRIVRARAPLRAQDRHLFVGGLRASRTRMLPADSKALFLGAVMTDMGFELAGHHTPLRAGAEFVYPQSTSPWTEPRCAVARANRTFVEMAQPCWRNLVHKACGQAAKGPPTRPSALQGTPGLGAPSEGRGFVENVGWSAIRAAGEWALEAGYIYYAPRDGEAPSVAVPALLPTGAPVFSLDAVMPRLELLVRLTNLTDVSFIGFTFEHATWLCPGGPDGFVEQQTGCTALGNDPRNHECAADEAWSWKTPGNVQVSKRDANYRLPTSSCSPPRHPIGRPFGIALSSLRFPHLAIRISRIC